MEPVVHFVMLFFLAFWRLPSVKGTVGAKKHPHLTGLQRRVFDLPVEVRSIMDKEEL
jgi:hypothetical protein